MSCTSTGLIFNRLHRPWDLKFLSSLLLSPRSFNLVIINESSYHLRLVHYNVQKIYIYHCVKSVRIRSYSGPHFSRISGPNTGKCGKNVHQYSSENGLFLRSVSLYVAVPLTLTHCHLPETFQLFLWNFFESLPAVKSTWFNFVHSKVYWWT